MNSFLNQIYFTFNSIVLFCFLFFYIRFRWLWIEKKLGTKVVGKDDKKYRNQEIGRQNGQVDPTTKAKNHDWIELFSEFTVIRILHHSQMIMDCSVKKKVLNWIQTKKMIFILLYSTNLFYFMQLDYNLTLKKPVILVW